MKKIFNFSFLTLLVFLFASVASNAQETNLKPITSEAVSLGETERNQVNSLMFDFQPTAFIIGSKIIGEIKPTKVEVGSGDFATLFQDNEQFNSVELLLVKVTDRNQISNKLEISRLSSFENLKYIIVECHFDCSPPSIKNMFSELENYSVFYSVSIPR